MQDTLAWLVFSEEAKTWFADTKPTFAELMALWNVLSEEHRNHYLTEYLPIYQKVSRYHKFIKNRGPIIFKQNPGIYRSKALVELRRLWKIQKKSRSKQIKQ